MRLQEITTSLKTVLGGSAAALLIKLLSLTVSWREVVGRSEQPTTGVIVAFWHGRMLLMPSVYRMIWRGRTNPPYMLISQHGDGRLIAWAIKLLGFFSVAGSSTRGGRRALLELIRKGRSGADLGFTPDGPRGPRYVCKDGVVLVAQKTGLPVYPMAYAVDRRWQLASWDGMIIPKPFARAVAIVGEPIVIREDEDTTRAVARVQEALSDVTQRADTYWDAS